jgi:hypothetical protein
MQESSVAAVERGPCSYLGSVAPQADGIDGWCSEGEVLGATEARETKTGDERAEGEGRGRGQRARTEGQPGRRQQRGACASSCVVSLHGGLSLPTRRIDAHRPPPTARPRTRISVTAAAALFCPRTALTGLLTKATRPSMPVLCRRIIGACTPPVRSPGPPVPSSTTTAVNHQPRSSRHRHEHCNVPVQTRSPDKLPCRRRIEPESAVGSLPALAAGSASFRCFPPSFLAKSPPSWC